MSAIDIAITLIKAVGGIALFIYGMTILGQSLEKASGGSMEKVLQKLTSNVIKAVLLGAFVTAAIQSSAATTVIVVGLVNAGILSLSSAVGVIMGANIGTTITGQILRLTEISGSDGSFLKLLTPECLAPILAAAGLVVFMAAKSDKAKNAGQILIGIGILFTGMLSLTAAVSPLKDLPAFRSIFETLQNPILGILAGIVVTVLLQSSSASVGILQAIATTGVLKFSAAFPIIMGQNIGTCVTPLISSVGAGKNAKRAAFVHIYFNIIGTVLFLIVMYAVQYTVGLAFWNENMTMGSIANFHTTFNIVVTIVLIPFHKLLEKLATVTIKDGDTNEDDPTEHITVLDDRLLKSPALAIQQSLNTAILMGKTALSNYTQMRTLFRNFDEKTAKKLHANENMIDKSEDNLNAYLVKLTRQDLTEYENRRVTMLLHMTTEFERIGDYAMNLIQTAEHIHDVRGDDDSPAFSAEAMHEFDVICDAIEEIVGMSIQAIEYNDVGTALQIEPLEEVVDHLSESLKERHIQRLKEGKCYLESGINFIDILTNLERISDHCSNIAVYVIGSNKKNGELSKHEYIKEAHKGTSKEYQKQSEEYLAKYSV